MMPRPSQSTTALTTRIRRRRIRLIQVRMSRNRTPSTAFTITSNRRPLWITIQRCRILLILIHNIQRSSAPPWTNHPQISSRANTTGRIASAAPMRVVCLLRSSIRCMRMSRWRRRALGIRWPSTSTLKGTKRKMRTYRTMMWPCSGRAARRISCTRRRRSDSTWPSRLSIWPTTALSWLILTLTKN